MITAPSLKRFDRVRHGFFTRQGGVSEGVFQSLNCGFGSGDNPEHIAGNRTAAMRRLGLEDGELLTLYQVHSAEVAIVKAPWKPGEAPRADGAVTRVGGLALGILSADCAPVLLADEDAGVIGAVHAGWKGALAGVAEAAVEAMRGLGAETGRIAAVIGPCIQQASYEVGPEFQARFVDADSSNEDFFAAAAREDHFMFDLPGYLVRRLEGLGVAVETVADDTCADESRFFSYRRATQRGEKEYGRGLAAIVLGHYHQSLV